MKMRRISMVLILALLLSACAKKKVSFAKLDKTPYAIKKCQKELNRGREYRGTPIAKIVVHKKKRQMRTYDAKGKQMHEFRISLGKNGDKGHKIQVGDYKTPIGHYRIVRKKCDRGLHKSLMISYPDSEDKARAKRLGVNPGGYVTIHGQPKWNADGRGDSYTLAHDWTEGCIAVPNKAIDALWVAVHNGVKIDIHP
jgi:murein L,D-transpeptidase YafK